MRRTIDSRIERLARPASPGSSGAAGHFIQGTLQAPVYMLPGPVHPDTRSEVSLALASDIRAVHRALRLRVRDHGGSKGLTASQLSVLVRLEADGPTTVSSLARAESMRPQSMRDVVAPLQKKGLVSSSPDPQDRRQILMALTPECTEWIKAGKTASHDWLTDAISRHLTVAEQRQLGEALILLRRVVQTEVY